MITSEKKNKHMTLSDRIEIQNGLNLGLTFKAIAEQIEKDPTTISKEVKLHAHEYANSYTNGDAGCTKLMKAPFVCNGCKKKNTAGCRFRQLRYDAKTAQKEYEELLVESREGIPLNKETFYETESKISNAVRSGQHIYHAIKSNNIGVSISTVYRHIKKGYYNISPIDLPRMVKFRPRKSITAEYVPKGVKIGRTYDDFLNYITENGIIQYVEIDTVIGRIGGKVIMTFHFIAFDFMFGILLDNKTAAEAGSKITSFKDRLKESGFTFGSVFPVLLTDNGGEFSNVFAFENNSENKTETHMFFCHPNSPYEKPHVEKNHSMFRDIVPSGSSFDGFSQDTVNKIFSHVNAVSRKQFNGKSAYDLFSFSYSAELAKALGIDYVAPENVIQSPALLR